MRSMSQGRRIGRVLLATGVAWIACWAIGTALAPAWSPQELPEDQRLDELPPIPDAAYGEGTATGDIARQHVRIPVRDATLDATVLVPREPGPKPGLVLVHGAGPRTRSDLLHRAEYFARSGIVTLVYDKRKVGYSTATHRDFELLADDAVAAVDVLRKREDVDPTRVGLWGISEGAGWVLPVAAASAPERVSFIIPVSAPVMTPGEELSWWVDKGLRQAKAPFVVRRSIAFALSSGRSGVFGALDYVDFDPLPYFRRVSQPVLAIYGTDDRTTPIALATRRLSDALRSNGNDAYTILLFDDADHGIRVDSGGFAPGYQRIMVQWIRQLPDTGDSWPSHIHGASPDQRYAMTELPKTPWYGSFPSEVSIIAIAILAFLAGPLARAFLRRRVSRTSMIGTEVAWTGIRRSLRRVTASSVALHIALPLCLMGSVGVGLASLDLPWVVNGVWVFVRLLALGALVAAAVATDRTVSELRKGWRPDATHVVSLAGCTTGFLLLTLLAAYWGVFALQW